MGKKNILFMNHGQMLGGAEESLGLLLKHIDRDKYHPVVLAERRNKRFIKYLKDIDIKIINFEFIYGNPLKNIFKILKSVRKLDNIVKEENIDLLYANTAKTHKLSCLYKVLYNRSIKNIYHIRELNAKWRIFDREIVPGQTCRAIAVSEAIKTRYVDEIGFKPDNIKIVYNSAESQKSYSSLDLRKQYGIKEKKFLAGCAGRIATRKGYENAIKAVSEISEKDDIFLLIAGEEQKSEDNYKNKLQKLVVEKDMNDRIFFTGYIDNIELFMKELDVFIMPTLRNESFGRTVLEAMLCGIPVIGTDVGGIPEIIEDGKNGFIVESGNFRQIAEKLKYLMENKNILEKMAKYAEKSSSEKFSVNNYITGVETVITETFKDE
ncbi:MAG: glycosyltransferase family 4 protein [Elusimicrobiota bacterium]